MHGRLTRAEALAKRRAYFERQRAEAEAALAIPDEDIVVTTYVGVWAQRNAQVVSE